MITVANEIHYCSSLQPSVLPKLSPSRFLPRILQPFQVRYNTVLQVVAFETAEARRWYRAYLPPRLQTSQSLPQATRTPALPSRAAIRDLSCHTAPYISQWRGGYNVPARYASRITAHDQKRGNRGYPGRNYEMEGQRGMAIRTRGCRWSGIRSRELSF